MFGFFSGFPALLKPNVVRGPKVGATAWEVGTWPTIRNRLNDAARDTWGNNGLPFGPGDFTGSFQWDLNIPNGGSAAILIGLSVNTPVPGPGALALLGFAGLAGRRRRRA